jgi:hypothetical protein
VDEDCDPTTGDESAVDASRWFRDVDADGVGRSDEWLDACESLDGHVLLGGDCDDGDPLTYPGADELCAVGDQDCDPATSDGDAVDTETWYRDYDGDGFGDGFARIDACEQPDGYLPTLGDCDDTNGEVNPDGVEVCDGLDNDCDPSTSELDDPVAREVFLDADGDGFGDPERPAIACGEPLDDHVSDATDCDDSEPLRNPGLPEICGDGLDNDCIDDPSVCGVLGDAGIDTAVLSLSLAGIESVAHGDTNADGLPDLLLGTPGEALAGPAGGGVYLFSGPVDGELAPGDEVAHLVGQAGDVVGASIASFDADGDGAADWLVGAPGAGEVMVIPSDLSGLGLASSVAVGVFIGDPGLSSGVAIASAGEVAFVGETDAVVAVRGTGGLLVDGDRLVGEGVGEQVATGDLDGDGIADVVVSSPDASAVWVVPGPLSGVGLLTDLPMWQLDDDPAALAGSLLASGADVDGDGLDDALVADALGRAWVIGPNEFDMGLADAPVQLTGVGVGGISVIGDVDADGVGELFVTDESGHPTRIAGPVGPGVLEVETAGVWRVVDAGLGQLLGSLDVDDDGVEDLWVSDGAGVWAWLGQPGL